MQAEANPYRIPADDWFRVVNFSGGRSSAYMLWHILDAHDGQRPGLLCQHRQGTARDAGFREGVPITWLEFRYRRESAGGRRDPKKVHVVVDHASASRRGEPFQNLVVERRILPHAKMRSCTTELKTLTIRRFANRDLGWRTKDLRNIIGYRHDEQRRWEKAMMEQCSLEWPMVHARVDKRAVAAFWQAQPFDLGIMSPQGNCDLCFLKGERLLVSLIRDNPELADWWIDIEESIRVKRASVLRKKETANFSKRFTFAELRARALASPIMDFNDGDDDELEYDCFCTD